MASFRVLSFDGLGFGLASAIGFMTEGLSLEFDELGLEIEELNFGLVFEFEEPNFKIDGLGFEIAELSFEIEEIGFPIDELGFPSEELDLEFETLFKGTFCSFRNVFLATGAAATENIPSDTTKRYAVTENLIVN